MMKKSYPLLMQIVLFIVIVLFNQLAIAGEANCDPKSHVTFMITNDSANGYDISPSDNDRKCICQVPNKRPIGGGHHKEINYMVLLDTNCWTHYEIQLDIQRNDDKALESHRILWVFNPHTTKGEFRVTVDDLKDENKIRIDSGVDLVPKLSIQQR